jgi:ATP-binding cassette subfamily B protein
MKIVKKDILKNFHQFKKTALTSKRLLGMLWQIDKWLFIGTAVSVSIPAILPFINAFIYKLIIDLVVNAASGSPFQLNQLYLLLGIRVTTLFIQDAAFSAQNYFEVLLWTKFPIHLYQSVLSKLSGLDVEYFEDSSFKDRLEKVKEAYVWRPINMLSFLFYGWQNLLQFVVALAAIAALNWLLIILFLLVAFPTFINQTNYAKISWGVWQQNSPYRKKFWYLSDLIQSGASVKEIKIFQVARRFLAELGRLYRKFVKDNTEIATRQFRTNIFLNLFGTAVYIGIEIFIILSSIAKKITIGDIGYFTAVLINFQNAVNGLFRNISSLFDSGLYVQEVFELLDTRPKIIKPRQGVKINIHQPPLIEFRHIGFSYPGSRQAVFDDFSLTIKPGQKIALVGENGAGKTTLIKLLARFYDVDKGEILIDGVNLKRLDLPTWYQALGVLFQDFIKYEYPLKDNIYFGKIYQPENLQDIIRAAKLAGADSVAAQLPGKYDQMLGRTFEGGVDLSAGQWQKVALARAFFRDAPILILDEPTASIDAKAEAEIFDRVENLAADKTLIIISHRFSTVRNADRIFVIDKGKITEEGNHDQLMKQNKTYATLFNLQAKGYK